MTGIVTAPLLLALHAREASPPDPDGGSSGGQRDEEYSLDKSAYSDHSDGRMQGGPITLVPHLDMARSPQESLRKTDVAVKDCLFTP